MLGEWQKIGQFDRLTAGESTTLSAGCSTGSLQANLIYGVGHSHFDAS